MAKTNPDSQSPVIAQMLVTFAFLAVLVWSALDPLHMSWFVFPFSIVVTMTGIILFELVRILADKQYRELLEKRAGGKGRFILNLMSVCSRWFSDRLYCLSKSNYVPFGAGPAIPGSSWRYYCGLRLLVCGLPPILSVSGCLRPGQEFNQQD
jgi:hypothetical protein